MHLTRAFPQQIQMIQGNRTKIENSDKASFYAVMHIEVTLNLALPLKQAILYSFLGAIFG